MTDTELFRHTLATLAYRAGKAMRGVPDTFADFKGSPTSRTPLEIVAHIGDLFDWAHSMAVGQPKWSDSAPQNWKSEVDRFFAALKKFDDFLASGAPIHHDLAHLFQGPVADALTHTGQLTMLRRIAGCPMKGESYNRADIVVGKVDIEQTPPNPKYEFD